MSGKYLSLKMAKFLVLVVVLSVAPIISSTSITRGLNLDGYATLPASGTISYPKINVTIESSSVLGVSNLSLGFMLDQEWKSWSVDAVSRELARNASFKLIRIFDQKPWASPSPCRYWNESSKTGTFNWTDVDTLVQRIFQIGAEPLFVFSGYSLGKPWIPTGMAVDPYTGLPYPESFAAYASEWVRHFRIGSLPVRFYEIMNEAGFYFQANPINLTRLQNYMNLFNAAATSMRQQNPNISISFDNIMNKQVLDFWLANGGADVDSLDFHKYGDWVAGRRTDAEMFAIAEYEYFEKWPLGYSIKEARQVWFDARGKLLPVIMSEGNFNSGWVDGTDPRIQQMAGAVWTALVLRKAVLEGLSSSVYFSFESSASYGNRTLTRGAGFGMVDADNNQPWYPYYAQQMLGNNLAPGDEIINATCSSQDARVLAWIHGRTVNVLIVSKTNQTRQLEIQGLRDQKNITRIDSTIPWETPRVQTSYMNSTDTTIVNGYTVMLLQVAFPTYAAALAQPGL